MKPLTAQVKSLVRNMSPDWEPLKIPAFRSLYLGGIAPAIGASMTFIVIQQQIYSLTGQSSMVGLASLLLLIPVVVFGLLGGLIADKFDRRKILLVTTSGVGVSAVGLGVAALFEQPSVATLVTLTCIQQAFFAINQPTRQAIVPRLVPRSDLPGANSLLFSLFALSLLLGPVLGGILLSTIPIGAIYFLEALATLPMVLVITRLPSVVPSPVPPSAPPSDLGTRRTVHTSLFSPVILSVLLLDLIVTIGLQPRPLFPRMAAHGFAAQPDSGVVLGLLNSSIAFGFLIGTTTGRWLRRITYPGRAMLASAAAGAIAVAALSVARNLLVALICLVILGWSTLFGSTCRIRSFKRRLTTACVVARRECSLLSRPPVRGSPTSTTDFWLMRPRSRPLS